MDGSVFNPFLILGLVTALLNLAADGTVVLFAGPIGQRLRSSARFRRNQRISGCTLIGLGASVAVAEQN